MSANSLNANEYDGVFPSISDVIVPETHNLVLIYGTSDEDALRAMGFRVNRTMRRIENGAGSIEVGAGESVPAGVLTSDGHTRLVTTSEEDVFRIGEDNEYTIEEYGVGVSVAPTDGTSDIDGSEVYVGFEPHSDSPILGVRGDSTDRARGWDEDSLDQRGGVRADLTLTPNEDYPTTALSSKPRMQGLFRIDSESTGTNKFRFSFKNTADVSATLDVTAAGQSYEVHNIEDEQLIRQMLNPNRPQQARVCTYGGYQNTKPNLPPTWQENTVKIDHSELI